jgi:large subunit ribosomal protein L13
MKTTHFRARDVAERWYLYDASQNPLGRMASDIAMRLMGKDRPNYTASELLGAHVVVVNADKVKLTGTKGESKTYRWFTGYAGGLKHAPIGRVLERRPRDVVKLAVRRMLPKTNLGKDMLARLKVYAGSEHPHTAQKPQKVETLGS